MNGKRVVVRKRKESYIMKRKKNCVLAWCLTFVMLVCVISRATVCVHADSLYIIRIGLTNQLKQQSEVKISTKKIALGYCVNNRYTEYLHFESKSGFTLTPATGYYLVSDKVYTSYAAVKKALQQAQKIAAVKKHVYICMAGKNKWKIYAGGLTDVAQVSSWQNNLEQKLSTTFGAVTSYNGHRVMVKGSNNTIIYDGADTEQYVQIVANVLNKKGSKTLTINGCEYRGRLEVGPYGTSKLTTVNIMNVENYLRSVVGSEMSQNTSLEAMKAQAVASRTYAQNRCDNTGDTNISTPYQINDTATYQKYGGYGKENTKSVEAVTSTRGLTMYAGGEQILSYFFPSSGGVTETSANVWGNALSYLRAVPDIGELQLGKKAWSYTYTKQELGTMLGVGTVTDLQIDKVTPSSRVMQISVSGTDKNIVLKGENISQKLQLPSNKFELIKQGDNADEVSMCNGEGELAVKDLAGSNVLSGKGELTTLGQGNFVVMGNGDVKNYDTQSPATENEYKFAGMGEGHGVGMSQAGAKAMAEKGYTYDQILTYYYGNIAIR